MKKLALAVLLVCSIAMPSLALAGEGATKFYLPMFNDRDWDASKPFYNRHYIQATNPNDYPATFEITYYKQDGTSYGSVTHTNLPAHAKIAWRPSADLGISSGDFIGSCVINVTDGSINMKSGINRYAGGNLNDSGYNVGDPLCSCNYSLQTVPSTYLTLGGFVHYDPNNDSQPLSPGESVTWVNINNPDDAISATVDMTFYDTTGNTINMVPITLSLAPHELQTFTPSAYGYTNISGSVVINIKKGSIVASWGSDTCNGGKTNSYGMISGPFNKRLTVE